METSIPETVTTSFSEFVLDLQKQRDRRNFFHFAMRLRPQFESLRGSILHRSPLPSLTVAISKFITEETRLHLLSPSQPTTALTTTQHDSSRERNDTSCRQITSSHPKSKIKCKYYKKPGYVV